MKDGLSHCSRMCIKLNQECPVNSCRMWIDYPEDKNCSLVAIYEHGCMTLRQIGDRLNISFARVKQLEQRALIKLKRNKMIL